MQIKTEMTRRSFLQTGLGALGGLAVGSTLFAETPPRAMTVTGAISPAQMGFTLPHEHIMSVFGGPLVRRAEYDVEKLFSATVPYLKDLKARGLDTLCDCTTAYFGRRADLLKTLSRETGIQILTNTGYYGAADDRYVPDDARTATVDQLTARWLSEWETGIDQTDIRPGFIKIGVDAGPLSPIDARLIRAAAQTHLHSGLTIAAHTGGSAEAAFAQLRILQEEKGHPSAWIWVHAHSCSETDSVLAAAKSGAWIEFDGVAESTLERHLAWVNLMRDHGFLNQVLLSHDGNSFRFGDRPFKPYASLFTHLLPRLKKAGYSQEEIVLLTRTNPGNAFAIRIRKLS
ncbi:MAG: phosphotriesterase [bacterium]|nr:phosphotriesterase [bacterium]